MAQNIPDDLEHTSGTVIYRRNHDIKLLMINFGTRAKAQLKIRCTRCRNARQKMVYSNYSLLNNYKFHLHVNTQHPNIVRHDTGQENKTCIAYIFGNW